MNNVNEIKKGKRKKIVHIVEAFGGGVYSYLKDLLNVTINQFDITVIYAVRNETPSNFEMDFDKRIRFIKSKYLTRNIGFNDISAYFEIKKLVNSEKPDIVHCHSSKAGFITRLAVNTKKVKTFYTPHGYSFLMQDNSKLKRFLYMCIEKIGAMNHSITIACSIGEYKESLKFSKKSICISNGINIQEIEKYIPNSIKSKDSNKLVIATIGRICAQKNPRLFNSIAEYYKDVQFIWIGDGELRKELCSTNIKITGWQSKEKLIKIINNADIFILTSLWEGLPISLLEAMSLKKICIVSNVIGNNNVIRHEDNGFVCNNLNEFVNIIEQIRLGKYNINKILQNAYEDVSKNYNIDLMCQKYIDIYSK